MKWIVLVLCVGVGLFLLGRLYDRLARAALDADARRPDSRHVPLVLWFTWAWWAIGAAGLAWWLFGPFG